MPAATPARARRERGRRAPRRRRARPRGPRGRAGGVGGRPRPGLPGARGRAARAGPARRRRTGARGRGPGPGAVRLDLPAGARGVRRGRAAHRRLPRRRRVGWRTVAVAIATMTALSFVAVGVGPRTLGRQHADRVGLVGAPVLIALTRVLGPLARLLVFVGNLLTPGPGYRDGPFASEAELRELVDIAEQSELIEAGEREMIHSVFELGDTLVREVMVPRTALVSIESGEGLRSAMSLFLRSGFSRVPVVGEGLDDVRGVLYLKDVARRLHEDPVHGPGEAVDVVMREVHFVPDSKPADDLLRDMQRSANHVAVVVDEYGGTAGMVTLEDLVEEIVGEIADEYDHEEPDVEKLGDDLFRVPSRLHVEDLGELFGLELEDEEVDTVGGLLAKALGRVPIAGASAQVGDLVLTAERFEGRRNQLATVLVRRAQEPVEDADPAEQDQVAAS